MDFENALAAAGGLTIGHSHASDIQPSYNVTPTSTVWIARSNDKNVWLEPVRWGLVARWSKDPSKGPHPINARADTVATSKLFAPLLKKRRCLVPCDGFYEWQQSPSGKQPYVIRMKTNEPFFFAGLYDIWHEGEPDALATFTIITGEPNELVAPIHTRMPVIVKPADYERWLDPNMTDPAALADIFTPYPADEMSAYKISKAVNSPKNNRPEILNYVESGD